MLLGKRKNVEDVPTSSFEVKTNHSASFKSGDARISFGVADASDTLRISVSNTVTYSYIDNVPLGALIEALMELEDRQNGCF